MEIGETLYVKNRKEFRAWLDKNHSRKKEIWLIYYKKHTGKPRIPYDDAVEEAICFGWIDSTVKRIDDEKYCQRYTPRNKKSIWSDLNVMRVKKMLDADRITPAGLEKIPPEVMKAARSGKIETFSREGQIIPKVLEPPQELLDALAQNKRALENWDNFPPSRRRQIIYWIGDAKRPETRERRIEKAVKLAEDNVRSAM